MLFIFDMGGVVTNTFKFDRMYEKLGLTSKEFFDICKTDNYDIKHAFDIGEIHTADFWKLFNERAARSNKNIPVVKNDLFRLYFHPVLNEETVELIKALRKKHRVVCGTNTIDSHWENHMERGDYSYFDQTYASNKIGEAKPDVNFYKLILEAENFKAEDAFFTDDRLDNIEAAASIGINAVQFTSAKELKALWGKYC